MQGTNILVLGYFGFEKNELCGQTVKTRNVYSLLKNKIINGDVKVSYFDTQSFQTNKVRIIQFLIDLSNADIVYYLPASKNLTYIFPILFVVAKLFKVQIHYIIIGGWLGDYLKSKRLHRWMLKRIYKIYSETISLKNLLTVNYGFKNVVLLHNFRKVDFLVSKENDVKTLGLVFMARINPMKGVNVLFQLSKKLKDRKLDHIFIDIYGPIVSDFKKDFKQKLQEASDNINYKGILEPLIIHETLSEYDLMLFPTKYYTEGFPGSILDSYTVGMPVIATNWIYASEFIVDNQSGVIVDFDNEDAFIEKVIEVVENPELLHRLKKGALQIKDQYSADKAWDILRSNIKIRLE